MDCRMPCTLPAYLLTQLVSAKQASLAGISRTPSNIMLAFAFNLLLLSISNGDSIIKPTHQHSRSQHRNIRMAGYADLQVVNSIGKPE